MHFHLFKFVWILFWFNITGGINLIWNAIHILVWNNSNDNVSWMWLIHFEANIRSFVRNIFFVDVMIDVIIFHNLTIILEEWDIMMQGVFQIIIYYMPNCFVIVCTCLTAFMCVYFIIIILGKPGIPFDRFWTYLLIVCVHVWPKF